MSVRAYRRALAVLLALLSLIPILVLAGREWALLTVLSELLPFLILETRDEWREARGKPDLSSDQRAVRALVAFVGCLACLSLVAFIVEMR